MSHLSATKELRITALQNSAGTPPGALAEWAFGRGHALDLRRLYAGDPLPEDGEFDWVISLGGSMNCDQVEEFPYLMAERQLLRRAIENQKGVLGLCLGAQIMARALGATVAPNENWEVGWHPVKVSDPLLGSGELTVFQWHQDTFSLPSAATRLATNFITSNQGFRISRRAVGVQFHPEATQSWVQECIDDKDYPSGPYVQDKDEIRRGLIHLPAMTFWFERLLRQMEGEL